MVGLDGVYRGLVHQDILAERMQWTGHEKGRYRPATGSTGILRQFHQVRQQSVPETEFWRIDELWY